METLAFSDGERNGREKSTRSSLKLPKVTFRA
jgi:hypothetical protein